MKKSPNKMSASCIAPPFYKCCPGTSSMGPAGIGAPNDCSRKGTRCVCYGFGHDIDPTCSDGSNGSPCCSDEDCGDGTSTTGYCSDKNTCVVWDKWANGHACTQDKDCASNYCSCKEAQSSGGDWKLMSGVCHDSSSSPHCAQLHSCRDSKDCAPGLTCDPGNSICYPPDE